MEQPVVFKLTFTARKDAERAQKELDYLESYGDVVPAGGGNFKVIFTSKTVEGGLNSVSVVAAKVKPVEVSYFNPAGGWTDSSSTKMQSVSK